MNVPTSIYPKGQKLMINWPALSHKLKCNFAKFSECAHVFSQSNVGWSVHAVTMLQAFETKFI